MFLKVRVYSFFLLLVLTITSGISCSCFAGLDSIKKDSYKKANERQAEGENAHNKHTKDILEIQNNGVSQALGLSNKPNDIGKAHGNQNMKFLQYYDRNQYAPDNIPIFDESDNKVYLEQFEGNLVLIAFWATWCAHCTDEMLDLDILQKDFKKLPFKVIPISEDYSGVGAVHEFYKTHDLRHLPIFIDRSSQLFQAFELSGLPTAFLVNEEGIIIAKFSGLVSWHDEVVRSMLLSYMPGNHQMPRNTYKESAFKFNKNNGLKKHDSPEEKVEQKTEKDDLDYSGEEGIDVDPTLNPNIQEGKETKKAQKKF